MIQIYDFIKKYREEIMTLGFLIFIFGMWLGGDVITNDMIKDFVFWVISPFGLLLLLFGYVIIHVKNPRNSLMILLIYVAFVWILLQLIITTTNRYVWFILANLFWVSNMITIKYLNIEGLNDTPKEKE